MPWPIKVSGQFSVAPKGIKNRRVEPLSPQSTESAAAAGRPVPVICKALRPGSMLGISSTAASSAFKQRIVASISLDILILSTILVPAARPAQIISRCPMLLEEGACTVPCNFAGYIFTVASCANLFKSMCFTFILNIPAPAAIPAYAACPRR